MTFVMKYNDGRSGSVSAQVGDETYIHLNDKALLSLKLDENGTVVVRVNRGEDWEPLVVAPVQPKFYHGKEPEKDGTKVRAMRLARDNRNRDTYPVSEYVKAGNSWCEISKDGNMVRAVNWGVLIVLEIVAEPEPEPEPPKPHRVNRHFVSHTETKDDKELKVAVCGKRWTTPEHVEVAGDCPDCKEATERSWMA